MSIEIFVLSDRRLGSIADWQQAIDAEGFDLRLDTSRPFEALSGHLPAQRGAQHAGFECDHWDPHDIIDSYEHIDFGHPWTQTLAFRFGGDAAETGSPLARRDASILLSGLSFNWRPEITSNVPLSLSTMKRAI